MDAAERILQFADLKGFGENKKGKSLREFYFKIDVTQGTFKAGRAVSSDALKKICDVYPDLNADWVITGRGEMEYREPQMLVGSDEGAKLAIQVQKDTIMELQAKLIKCMEGQGYVPLSMNEAMPKEEKVE